MHGLDNTFPSLHYYIASVLNSHLLFGYAQQVLTRGQLRTDSSSVSRLTASAHFVPHGSNNSQWLGGFLNFTSMCRWSENSATCESDGRSNATNIAIYFNAQFVSTTHPKRDVTLITFDYLLLERSRGPTHIESCTPSIGIQFSNPRIHESTFEFTYVRIQLRIFQSYFESSKPVANSRIQLWIRLRIQ